MYPQSNSGAKFTTNEPQPHYMNKNVFNFLYKEMGDAKPQLFAVGGVVHVCACLLDAQTVEQVVRRVWLSIRSFYLRDETHEAFAQLSWRALKDVLIERHGRS